MVQSKNSRAVKCQYFQPECIPFSECVTNTGCNTPTKTRCTRGKHNHRPTRKGCIIMVRPNYWPTIYATTRHATRAWLKQACMTPLELRKYQSVKLVPDFSDQHCTKQPHKSVCVELLMEYFGYPRSPIVPKHNKLRCPRSQQLW